LRGLRKFSYLFVQRHGRWQAIQRQYTSKSGKPLGDEVANTTDEALKINSLIAKVALPRGIEPLFQP
jgi:hypothetical protein